MTATDTPPKGILVDSGCTSHLFGDRSYFTSWDEKFTPGSVEVILADGRTCRDAVTGRGNVTFPVKDDTGSILSIHMTGVLYMPKCEYAEIYSIRKGIETGDQVIFSKRE